MTREEEFKVDLTDLGIESARPLVLDSIDAVGLEVVRESQRSQISRYFDSPDGALAQLNVGLRFRSSITSESRPSLVTEGLTTGRWCLKLPYRALGHVASVIRDEFEVEGTGSGPPRELFLALDYVFGGLRPLTSLALIRTDRSTFIVATPGDRAEAEVDVDDVSILEPSLGHFVEVEIESLRGAMTEAPVALFHRLTAQGGRASSRSKLERALGNTTEVEHQEGRPPTPDFDYQRVLGLKVRLGACGLGSAEEMVWNALEMLAWLIGQGGRWSLPRSVLALCGCTLAYLVRAEQRSGPDAVTSPFSSMAEQQWVATLCDGVADFEESWEGEVLDWRLGPPLDFMKSGLGEVDRCLAAAIARADREAVRRGYEIFLRTYFELDSERR